QTIVPRQWFRNYHFAISVGDAKVGRIQHVDISQHGIVNITANNHFSRLIKKHRLCRFTVIETQLKRLSRRKRVNMVTYVVTVWKINQAIALYRQNMGHESIFALIHHRSIALATADLFKRNQSDNSVFYAAPLIVINSQTKVFGPGMGYGYQ